MPNKVVFNCEKCGIEVSITKYKYTKNICRKCKMAEAFSDINKIKKMKEKRKQTNLEKYGVDNPSKSTEIKEKKKQTNLEKYGVEHTFQSDSIKEKIKQTNLEKYGVDNPSKSTEIKEKIFYRVKELNYTNLKKRVELKGFCLLTNFENYKDNNFRETPVKIKCNTCRTEIDFYNIYGSSYFPLCRICNKEPVGGSFEEDELFTFISSFYKKEIKRNIKIHGNEIDIFVPELNIGFEYNGLYWHSEISGGKTRNYHLKKQEVLKEKGIQLFHIFSNNWIHKKEIVKSIIKNKFSICENKIMARKCKIREVSNKESEFFIENNHIQGNTNASVKIGLYYNNELVSLTTFGKNRYSKKYEWELYRFCNKLNTQVVGGFSKMLKYFEKNYTPNSIITFSEKALFNNNTYNNSGFNFIGCSPPNYYYIKKYSSGFVETRVKYQKHKLPELLENFNPELTEWENMVTNGYDRFWDCGNRVFIKEYKRV